MTRERALAIWNSAIDADDDAEMMVEQVAVDAILAACEQERREERMACAERCRDVAAEYPTQVFPENSDTVDSKSASMARHVAELCAKAIEASKP